MDLPSVMSQLKSLGTAPNIQTYKRHGSDDNVFGVSYADLKKLRKKLGTDHPLALSLWNTGNTDARSLATMVANPEKLTATTATQWMKDVNYPPHAAEVAAVMAQASCGFAKMRQWRKQKSEYARTIGYCILACLLKEDAESVDEAECLRVIREIEMEVHRSPNQAKHAMVMALIAIGIYKTELSEEAIEAGDRIGDVSVDHGDTSCKTPQVAPSIRKALKRSATKSR